MKLETGMAGAVRPVHGNSHSRNLVLGIGCSLVSMVMFSLMDASIKWLGASYPVHQIMFFRCLLAFVPLLIFMRHAGGFVSLKTRQPGLQALRSTFGLFAMCAAFYGFTVLPLADASAVFYTAPLIAIAFSVPILGERIGFHRWAAVILGLVGVLIITRPGGSVFNPGGLAMFLAAVLIGVNSNLIRILGTTDAAVATTFYFTLSSTVLTACSLYVLGWVSPSGLDWLWLCCVGFLGGTAQYMLALSFRYAEVGIVSPFKYLSIVIGGILGFVFWSEIPDTVSLAGMCLIIGCGLYSIYRETLAARMLDRRERRADTQTTQNPRI